MDGCFWHGCPEHHTVAATNATFWAEKVLANRARDRDTDRQLTDAGWTCVRVWEHEDPHQAAAEIRRLVDERRFTGTRGNGDVTRRPRGAPGRPHTAIVARESRSPGGDRLH